MCDDGSVGSWRDYPNRNLRLAPASASMPVPNPSSDKVLGSGTRESCSENPVIPQASPAGMSAVTVMATSSVLVGTKVIVCVKVVAPDNVSPDTCPQSAKLNVISPSDVAITIVPVTPVPIAPQVNVAVKSSIVAKPLTVEKSVSAVNVL